jgi:hypothetical protein
MGKQYEVRKFALGGSFNVKNVSLDNILDIEHFLKTNNDKKRTWYNISELSRQVGISRSAVLTAVLLDHCIKGKDRLFDLKASFHIRNKGFVQVVNLVKLKRKNV